MLGEWVCPWDDMSLCVTVSSRCVVLSSISLATEPGWGNRGEGECSFSFGIAKVCPHSNMGIEGGGIHPKLPGPLLGERTPSGDRTPDLVMEPECWVVCALLCPLFMGTSALLFAEFYLPKSLGLFPCTVTKTMQPLTPASLLYLPLDRSLFFPLASLSISLCF